MVTVEQDVYAGFSQHYVELEPPIYIRGLAFLIDIVLIYFVILSPLEGFLRRFIPSSVSGSELLGMSFPPGVQLIVLGTIGFVGVLYFSLFEYYLGRTPGMKVFDIQTTVSSFWQAVVRNIFVIPVFPFTLLLPVEVYCLYRKGRRCLESFTKTKTIQRMSYR